MELDQPLIIHPPLSYAQSLQLIDTLFHYFQDSQWKGTISNLQKDSFLLDSERIQAWIPIHDLFKFKKIASITTNPLDVLNAIESFAPNHFTISQDRFKIQKAISFTSSDIEKEAMCQSIVSCLMIQVNGFPNAISAQEVAVFASKFGPIKNVHCAGMGKWNVEFVEIQDMIQFLSCNNPIYDDSPIYVSIQTKSDSHMSLQISSSSHTSMNSNNKNLKTTLNGIKFTPNRVVQFHKKQEMLLSLQGLKQAFERYSSVSAIDYEPEAEYGYIRFKKSIADKVVGLIEKDGGIYIDDEVLAIRALNEAEDVLYWDVIKEKEKKFPSTPSQPKISTNRKMNTRNNKSKKGNKSRISKSIGVSAHTRRDESSKSLKKVKIDDLLASFNI